MTSYGTVSIGGKSYIEREQTFPLEISVTTNFQVILGTLVLPGVADFWLKTRMAVTVIGGAASPQLFKFRMGNSDGSTWYQSGGSNTTVDRVLSPLLFGTGQFPVVVTPYIYYSASGGIKYEVEDVTGTATGAPYTIYFGFGGSYLTPASVS